MIKIKKQNYLFTRFHFEFHYCSWTFDLFHEEYHFEIDLCIFCRRRTTFSRILTFFRLWTNHHIWSSLFLDPLDVLFLSNDHLSIDLHKLDFLQDQLVIHNLTFYLWPNLQKNNCHRCRYIFLFHDEVCLFFNLHIDFHWCIFSLFQSQVCILTLKFLTFFCLFLNYW